MAFPDNCIRGIPNEQFVNEEGTLGSDLFYFQDVDRGDGWREQSINWEDDEDAIGLTLAQTRDDRQPKFRAGVAILPRTEIDRINLQPTVADLLGYERAPINGNPYHGNILLRAGTSKRTMKLIAASLALVVSRIIPQGDEHAA